MKHIMGLTGPTGAGKSTACRAAADAGVFVIDCDKTARKATDDRECLNRLASVFGEEILNPDGSLDRGALARRAFCSREQTERLNRTIFPFILDILKKEIENSGGEWVLLDAPTLFESGADGLCEITCAILADEKLRLERIMRRDGIDEQSTRLRMDAGKDEEYYKCRTRHIIYNDAGEKALYDSFSALLQEWIGGR